MRDVDVERADRQQPAVGRDHADRPGGRRHRGVRRLRPRPLHCRTPRTARSSTVRGWRPGRCSRRCAKQTSCVPGWGLWSWAGPTGTRQWWPTWSASLDHVSGGRAIARARRGLAGQRARGVRHRPAVGPRPLDRFEESVRVVASLLREPRTTFEGRTTRCTTHPDQPAPVQDRLPVLVAAAVSGGRCAPRRRMPTCGTRGHAGVVRGQECRASDASAAPR